MATKDESVKIIPGTKFVVDGFQIKNKKAYQHYFLTHFHADHYAGLTKTWKHGTVYCTKATANLAQKKFGIDAKYFFVLDFDTVYDIEGVKVTLYDANHCPGSSCMLFETPDGKAYLHTGDMRFDKDLFMTYETLKPFFKEQNKKIAAVIKSEDNQTSGANDSLQSIKNETEDDDSEQLSKQKESTVSIKRSLDAIYLDTTYCDPAYSFPKQAEATRFISDFVKSKLTSGDGKKYLFMFGTYQIGKERVAQRIAESCNCKVFVTLDKYRVLQALDLPYIDIFTTNPSQSSVHMVRMFDLAWKSLFELRKAFSGYDEIIAFRPSAWCFSEMDIPSISDVNTSCSLDDHFDVDRPLPKNKKVDKDGYVSVDVVFSRRSNITVVSVPYSEHSSFAELKDCVSLLRVKEIRPTVYKDQKHLVQIKNYLSEAFKHTPLKLKLSVPEELLNSSTTKSAKFTKAAAEVKNNRKITQFFSMASTIKSTVNAVSSVAGKITSFLSRQGSQHVSNTPDSTPAKRSSLKLKSPVSAGNFQTPKKEEDTSFRPPTSTEKKHGQSNTRDEAILIDENDTKPIDVVDIIDEEFVDLSQVDLSEQLHIMKTIEKQNSSPASTSTSSSPASQSSSTQKYSSKTPNRNKCAPSLKTPSAKPTLRLKRKSTTDNSNKQPAKKKQRTSPKPVEQTTTLASFWKQCSTSSGNGESSTSG